MIYLKYADNSIASYDFHYQVGQTNNVSAYHIETTDLNRVVSMGLGLQTIQFTAWLYQKTDLNLLNLKAISFDNSTWQTILGYRLTQWTSQKAGRRIPFSITLLVSPLREGLEHDYSSQWDGSISVSHSGNYKAIPKIVIQNPIAYFPFDTSIVGIYGNYLAFTSPARTYNGVSYNENEPVFDEGLYFNGDENSDLNISKTLSDYTIFFLLKWKNDTSYSGTILKTNKFSIDWTDSTHITLHGTADQTIAFPQTDYEAGKPVAVIITHKSDGSTSFICGVYDTTSETITTPASIDFTDTALNDITGTQYIGYDGATSHISEHSLSDLVVYPYEVPNPDTCEWHLTTEPINISGLYIDNTTSGTITFEDGVLTDSEGNNISYLISGMIPTANPDTTLEKTGGLSCLWSASVKDTYFP
jgi:hypothetical protein